MGGSDYRTIRVDREGALTWLTLNRPERLNALNEELLDELSDALRAERESSAKVLALRGAGRAFSSGYDIAPDSAEIGGAAGRDSIDDRDRLAWNLDRFAELWDHPKPVIAAVHGHCLAGATQLCIFCDITVVAEDAQIGWPALPVGGGYIAPLWVPLIGPKRAKQMSFVAGSTMSGRRAAAWGWANYAVPAAELEDDVRSLAGDIAKMPSEVLHMKKVAINRVVELQGFRAIASIGADVDALLHKSHAVRDMQQAIDEHGLKEAIRRFHAGE